MGDAILTGQKITVNEILDAYLEQPKVKARNKPNSLKRIGFCINRLREGLGQAKANELTQHVLTDYQNNRNGFVFTYHGKNVGAQDAFYKSFIQGCNDAGITYGDKKGGAVFHSLRHSFKSLMTLAGVNSAVRDLIAGHQLHGMDAHYVHANDETRREAMAQFVAYVDSERAKVSKALDLAEKNLHISVQ